MQLSVQLGVNARYRWMVFSRCMAAIFGGYAMTTAITVFLSLALPWPRVEAVLFAGYLSFIFYLIAIIWVFAAKSAWRAWLGILLPTVIFALLSYLIKTAVL
jgi:hypothetical protein